MPAQDAYPQMTPEIAEALTRLAEHLIVLPAGHPRPHVRDLHPVSVDD